MPKKGVKNGVLGEGEGKHPGGMFEVREGKREGIVQKELM